MDRDLQRVRHDVQAPERYSMVKSNNLLIHWCYGIVDKNWSNMYFKL